MPHARGTVAADAFSVHMSIDDQLMKRITRQVRESAKYVASTLRERTSASRS